MSSIKPIETLYAGIRFRSRLEARWAVLFDKLSIKWFYEYEGFETPTGKYLPDFWLPEIYLRDDRNECRQGVLLEVKPSQYEDTDHIALKNVANTLKVGAILTIGFYPDDRFGGQELIQIAPWWDRPMGMAKCLTCKQVKFDYPNYLLDKCPYCKHGKWSPDDSLIARNTAINFRFW